MATAIKIVDSYSESNKNTARGIAAEGSGYNPGHSQTFTGNSAILNQVKWYLKKINSPTGNIVAKIYASFDGKPNGEALATSDVVDVSTLNNLDYALVIFTFSGINKITLVNTTTYNVSAEYYGGDGSNFVGIGMGTTSPVGTSSVFDGTNWGTTSTTFTYCFYVYKDTMQVKV